MTQQDTQDQLVELPLDYEFDIVRAPKKNSLHWTAGKVTWGEMIASVKAPANKKECGNYVMGRLRPTLEIHKPGQDPCDAGLHRKARALIDRCALTLDVDSAKTDFIERCDELFQWSAIVHTTYSATKDQPRYRVIIPLDRPAAPDEYAHAAAAIMEQLDPSGEEFDPGSVQPERYMFRPSTNGDFYEEYVYTGPLLKLDRLLVEFDPDLSVLPMPRPHKNKRDPFELPGLPGAFNRAYDDFNELIEEFDLPYEVDGHDRWRLKGSVGQAGMGECAPGLWYSHHSTDPAFNKTCSAFDLVRIHKYGHLDDGAAKGTPVHKLPSHGALMDELSDARDDRINAEMLKDMFPDDLGDLQTDPDTGAVTDWRVGLDANSRSGDIKDTVKNWDLIRANDPLLTNLRYNEMTLSVEFIDPGQVSWRQGHEDLGPGLTAHDRAELPMYIERTYRGLRPSQMYLDNVVTSAAHSRRYNPVRDYLNGLQWDGKPRLATCLPGVRHTQYTRLVGRKVMVAAAARMLSPGIKWDHMLVIYGAQGLGKSEWVRRMSRGFSAGLGRIGDKDTLMAMRRSWIMTADELHSMKKADFDATKEFITKTSDMIRLPYDKEMQEYQRHCVIWGTTNDPTFLRRQEGNRRFLPVHAEHAVDFEALTDDYVDQVWAEAVTLYREGNERLYLDTEESEVAELERDKYTEESPKMGLIEEYVSRLYPADWFDRTLDSRQMYLDHGPQDMMPEDVPVMQLDTVCAMQIWVEAMGQRRGDHKPFELKQITDELHRLEGWRLWPGKKAVPGYGRKVQVWVRESSLSDDVKNDLELI